MGPGRISLTTWGCWARGRSWWARSATTSPSIARSWSRSGSIAGPSRSSAASTRPRVSSIPTCRIIRSRLFTRGRCLTLERSRCRKRGSARDDLVLIAPNDPGAMNRAVAECTEAGIPYLYDPSMQLPRLSKRGSREGMPRRPDPGGERLRVRNAGRKAGDHRGRAAAEGADHGDDAGRGRLADHCRR